MPDTIPFPLQLETERLIIRSPQPEDAKGLNEAVVESIDSLRPWMPWAAKVPTLAESEENCAKATEDFKLGKEFRLHLLLKDSGLFIGCSGWHRIDWSVPKLEIGYWIRNSCTGKGYITEAVDEITRYALDELGAKRVEIRTDARNTKSWRIPERLGFTLEGIFHCDVRGVDGKLRDTRIYAKTVRDHS